MENINGKNLITLAFKSDLIKIGDLQYYDGSLMTLFENTKNQDIYLFDWVDGDSEFNRWLVYLVNPIDIIKYLDLTTTHLNLIIKSSEIYIVDLDKHHNYHNVRELNFNHSCYAALSPKDFNMNSRRCNLRVNVNSVPQLRRSWICLSFIDKQLIDKFNSFGVEKTFLSFP